MNRTVCRLPTVVQVFREEAAPGSFILGQLCLIIFFVGLWENLVGNNFIPLDDKEYDRIISH